MSTKPNEFGNGVKFLCDIGFETAAALAELYLNNADF